MNNMFMGSFLLLLLLSSGCFYLGKNDYEDILKSPPQEWSSRDCLTIVLAVMQNNLSDEWTHIRLFATPYYPSVITAINRMEQAKNHISDDQFRAEVDTALAVQAGVYRDWQKQALVDSKGNYVRDETQFDSLLVLITFRNNGGISDAPDITDLEKRIFLENEAGIRLSPRYVWGRRRSKLEMEETLLAMFPLRRTNGTQFLAGSTNYFLVVVGFETPMRLQFPAARFR